MGWGWGSLRNAVVVLFLLLLFYLLLIALIRKYHILYYYRFFFFFIIFYNQLARWYIDKNLVIFNKYSCTQSLLYDIFITIIYCTAENTTKMCAYFFSVDNNKIVLFGEPDRGRLRVGTLSLRRRRASVRRSKQWERDAANNDGLDVSTVATTAEKQQLLFSDL